MAVLVRSWNLFHGNADPPRRRGYLRAMVELVSAGVPDVVCLQEVPVWALRRLEAWSGMTSVPAVTRTPLRPGPVSAWVTRLHQGLLRSAISGQANAVLVAPGRAVERLGEEQISGRGRERRLVQCVRVEELGVVANLHASNELGNRRVTSEELDRARVFAETAAREGEPVVLAGDFNLRDPVVPGYSPPGPGIDHILVRGAETSTLVVWPRERRLQNGVVLSDHAPVELEIG